MAGTISSVKAILTMSRYRYIKKIPRVVTIPVLPTLSVGLGVLLLLWVIWPIATFEIFHTKISGLTISPLAQDLIHSVKASESSSGVDLTRASNWFPQSPSKKMVAPVDSYTISIPRLRIVNALVKIGSDDLTKNLIHYGGTGLPGQYGRAVLFGHSVLPSFYDPKNYLTIFSLLPTLKEGDDIFVKFDGVDYRYQVVNQIVTSAEDVSGLEQMYDDSYITLVTCVPPGLNTARLWLTAKQVAFSQK